MPEVTLHFQQRGQSSGTAVRASAVAAPRGSGPRGWRVSSDGRRRAATVHTKRTRSVSSRRAGGRLLRGRPAELRFSCCLGDTCDRLFFLCRLRPVSSTTIPPTNSKLARRQAEHTAKHRGRSLAAARHGALPPGEGRAADRPGGTHQLPRLHPPLPRDGHGYRSMVKVARGKCHSAAPVSSGRRLAAPDSSARTG